MKQYYLITILGIVCHLSYAQPPIAYQYDAAGNRILRKENPLPVTLVYFKAEMNIPIEEQHPSALLKWQTSFETNSDYFEIQRSGDGKKWLEIGIVQANGEKVSDTDYTFIDKAPLEGENIYRLKMVDKDETFTYSRLQSLTFEAFIVFYPNPVKDRLMIKGVLFGEAQSSEVRIWDAGGRLVKASTGTLAAGIDMTTLPTGIYTIKITQRNGLITLRKVVKE